MIKISDSAKKQIQELLASIPEDNTFIRIYVAGGGCAGMKFNMIVDDNKNDGDEIKFSDSFNVVVDKVSSVYTEGLEIDYSDDLIKQGFSIKNPNMGGGCGCGASFNPEGKKSEGCGDCSNG